MEKTKIDTSSLSFFRFLNIAIIVFLHYGIRENPHLTHYARAGSIIVFFYMLSGFVLDLRNNPGGVLDAAVDVSDLFLDSGIIVSAEGRTHDSRFRRSAHRGDILDGADLIVLVNDGCASASEIVAGALHDHGRATIVGTPTTGSRRRRPAGSFIQPARSLACSRHPIPTRSSTRITGCCASSM